MFQESLAILSSRLVHEDKKSSETACLAMSRLAESYKNDKNRLRDIASADVLSNLQRILVTSPPNVSSNTFVTVLHVLGSVQQSRISSQIAKGFQNGLQIGNESI